MSDSKSQYFIIVEHKMQLLLHLPTLLLITYSILHNIAHNTQKVKEEVDCILLFNLEKGG
jgi:hypothetical protein